MKHSIDHLPPSVKDIWLFLTSFDLPINSPPPALAVLYLGDSFNQPLDKLPPSLRMLFIGEKFDHPLNQLPPGLSVLIFLRYSVFNKPITYPAHLRSLSLGSNFRRNEDLPPLPEGLLQFSLGDTAACNITSLPRSLEALNVNGASIKHLNSFPAGLQHVTFHCAVDGPLESLPAGCAVSLRSFPGDALKDIPQHIQQQVWFIDVNDATAPMASLQSFSSLTNLLCRHYDYPLPPLPGSLLKIQMIMGKFNQPLSNLPPSLKHLALGDSFNHPLDHLPPSLRTLHLGRDFNHPVHALPLSLRQLVIINPRYSHSMLQLPLSLVELLVGSDQVYQTVPPAVLPVTAVYAHAHPRHLYQHHLTLKCNVSNHRQRKYSSSV